MVRKGPSEQAEQSDAASDAARRRPLRGRGLSYRLALVLWMTLLVLLSGAVLTAVSVRTGTASATELARELFDHSGREAVDITRRHLASTVPLIDALHNLADGTLALKESEQLARQFTGFLRAYPGITWVSYGDEQGNFTGVHYTPEGGVRINRSWIVDGKTTRIEHNVAANGTWTLHAVTEDTGYDPRNRPFYRKAVERGGLVWLPPYLFYDTEYPGVTCARPVYRPDGQLRGVLTVDFELSALSKFVASERVSRTGQLLVLTSDGRLLASPARANLPPPANSASEPPTIAGAGTPLELAFYDQLTADDLSLAEGQDTHTRLFQFTHDGRPYFASATAFRIDRDLVWVVGAIAPQEDFLGAVWAGRDLLLKLAAMLLLIAVTLAVLLGRRVSRPVAAMRAFMARVGRGDLQSRADFGGAREFRDLAGDVNQMIADLRDRMRLLNSIELAQQVQRRLLPHEPPRLDGLDVFGHSIYAEETGGDYYDYLVLDRTSGGGKLLVAMGDVMGHGIAAALVMAEARAVLRSYCTTSYDLAAAMSHLNALLVEDLAGERFMTLHLSVIDPATGTFRWASAGHDPAIIYDPVSDTFHQPRHGELPLGILDDVQYGQYDHQALAEGSIILIGTDGIWETRGPAPQRDMFGKDRLKDAIRAAAAGSAEEIGREILARLDAFRGGGAPTDDVTFVVMKLVKAPVAIEPEPAAVTGQQSG